MKNNKMLFKVITLILALVITASIVVIPAAAAVGTEASPGIEVKNFKGNDVIRTIVNALVALLAVVGAIFGIWQLAQGFIAQDNKEKWQGVITLVGSLLLGGLMLAIVNMILK